MRAEQGGRPEPRPAIGAAVTRFGARTALGGGRPPEPIARATGTEG